MKSSFFPGDEWLYLKIYCGKSHANALLKTHVFEVAGELFQKNIIDKWFFIRYEDPEAHIRFRVKLSGRETSGKVFEILTEKFQKDISESKIWKMQIEPYQRELSRYGASNIETMETLFWADSIHVCRINDRLELNEDLLFLIAMRNMDLTFKAFGFSIQECRNLSMNIRDNLKEEFHVDLSHKRKLNDFYRERISTGFEELKIDNEVNSLLKEKFDVYERNLQHLEGDEKTLWNIYFGLNHMHCNRLFSHRQRLYELICYDFLIHNYDETIYRS